MPNETGTQEQDTEQVINKILDDWKAFQEQKLKLEADKKAKALQDAQGMVLKLLKWI